MKKLFVAAVSAIACYGFAAMPASAEDRIDGRVSYAGIRELSISSVCIDVEARSAAAGSELLVECVNLPTGHRLLAERRGDSLELRVETPAVHMHAGFFSASQSPKIVLSVPRGVLVDMAAASGDVGFVGHEAASLRVRTSSGDLSVTGFRGSLDAESSSGDIGIKSCNGAKRVKATSGDIDVDASDGDAEISASSGDIRVVDCGGRFSLGTSSGSIGLERVEGSLTIETSSGDITGRAVRLSGSSSFRTSSGEIGMDLENGLEELRFELDSSSGELSAGQSKGDHRLESGSGSIVVVGRSSSGDQRYKAK